MILNTFLIGLPVMLLCLILQVAVGPSGACATVRAKARWSGSARAS